MYLRRDLEGGRWDSVVACHFLGQAMGWETHRAGGYQPQFTSSMRSMTGLNDLPKKTIMAIRQHPENYYVNVHTDEFATGAIRGTLHK